MTIEEKLAEFGARPRSIVLAPGELDTLLQLHNDRVHALETAAEADKARLEAAVRLLEARIKEILEGQQPPAPPPPVEPPAPPTTGKRPAILYMPFDTPPVYGEGKLWSDPETSALRAECFRHEPGQLRFSWTSGRKHADGKPVVRSEIWRTKPNERETAARDPLGSIRFYRQAFVLADSWNTSSPEASHKAVVGQFHAGNGPNREINQPPGSFEIVRDELRFTQVLENFSKTTPLGKVPKGTAISLVTHAKWSAGTDGFLRIYRDNVKVLDYSGKTWWPCPPGEGVNHHIGIYSPGEREGHYTAGFRRELILKLWAIGSEENTLEEMLA